MGFKRKYEDSLREVDSLKRKISASKVDGLLEAQSEVDATRATLRDLEETHRTQQMELRKVREENVNLNSRLIAAIQNSQVSFAFAPQSYIISDCS